MGKFFKKKTKKGGLEGDAAGGADSVEGVNDDKENTAGHKADGEVTEDSTTKDAARVPSSPPCSSAASPPEAASPSSVSAPEAPHSSASEGALREPDPPR